MTVRSIDELAGAAIRAVATGQKDLHITFAEARQRARMQNGAWEQALHNIDPSGSYAGATLNVVAR